MDNGEKEVILQFNYAIASSQAYYVDLTHMNDSERWLGINTGSVDEYWQWNEPVAEIELNLAENIKNSGNVKLEFNLKATKTDNKPCNAFGIVMAEGYKGAALSFWDTRNENDGIKIHNLVGKKLAWNYYSADEAATLKWLETAVYGENGADIRAVRAGNTIKFFAMKDGKWVAFRSLACPADALTDIRFMGAGSDFVISGISFEEYTEQTKNYSAKLTVLDKEDNKVVLPEGAKGLLIAGDASYEVALTQNADGDYEFAGDFLPGLYSLSILGAFNGYSSAEVHIADEMNDATIKYGEYANPTVYDPNKADGEQLADCITVNDGKLAIAGNKQGGFWQWGNGNTVPAATLNLSDEIKASRNVRVDFKLKATNPNNQPNNAFGIAMTEFHNGAALSFWNVNNENDGISVHDLKGTWLGEDGWGDDKAGTFKWLETAIYGSGAYFRVERKGADITVSARNGNEWVEIHAAECYEYAETMVKFMGIGSDYDISGIRVRIPGEGDIAEYSIDAAFDGNSHGYRINVEPTVEEGEMATLIIETSDATAAWSYFPNAITINGDPVDFDTVTVESLGANRVRYTLAIENVMENLNVVVTVENGVKRNYSAAANNSAWGTVECDMENDGFEYYWNDACALTITAEAGYRLKSIIFGEGDSAQTVTEGWTKDGLVYGYTFIVEGDIKIEAVFEATPAVAFGGVKINALDKADAPVTLGEGAKLLLNGDYDYELALTKNEDGTYSAAAQNVYVGKYAYSITGVNYGYGAATVEITEDTVEITLKFGEIATVREENINYDDHGMPYVNLKDLVAVTDDTVKINTSKINETKMDGFYRWNSSVPEASLTLSEQAKNSANVQLEFNLKAVSPNDQPNNAFGIVMAEGYKGVNMSFWNTTNEVDGVLCRALKGCMLGNDEFGDDKNNVNDWVEVLAYGENGVNIRAIRRGASIKFFACNADGVWIKLFETSCAADAKTDIKFLGMGSDYTVSAINVTLPQEPLTVNATVSAEASGTIATDAAEYFANEECTVTVTAAANYELKQLAIGDTVLTSGWTQKENVYTYSFILTGDVNVAATLEDVSAAVNFNVTGEGLTDETVIKLTAKKDGTIIEFAKSEGVSKLIPGEYEVFVYGYKVETITVPADGGDVNVALVKTIAYASANDTKNEITVNDTDKTITITGNGLQDREPNQRKINAEYVISEEAKNSAYLTLTFNVKAAKKDNRGGNDWVGSRFGVQIGEGEIGFMVFPRNNQSGTASDVAQLIPETNLALNPDRDGKTENKWHGDDSNLAWLAEKLFSADGVNFKVVRADGVIHIYAQNGEDWVQLDVIGTKGETETAKAGDLTIGDEVKNRIIFTAGGDNWTFSDIEVSTAAEGGSEVTE